MMSVSELIRSKSENDTAWKEERRAERENISEMRDAALAEIASNPGLYGRYIEIQADNISCSAGNVALTMFQLSSITRIGPAGFWHEPGRRVRDDEFGNGAKVFVPPKNSKYRGYIVGDYYDISQTTGRPLKSQAPLEENSARMTDALASLMNYSPVGIAENNELTEPARYNDTSLTLEVNPAYGESEIFAALASEVAFARIHDKGRNADFDRAEYRLDAESVGYMICRRFGVDCKPPQTENVRASYEGYEPADIGEALEAMRKTARSIGDGIDRSIQPRRQEQGRRRCAAR